LGADPSIGQPLSGCPWILAFAYRNSLGEKASREIVKLAYK
jgi:hypothetical protein